MASKTDLVTIEGVMTPADVVAYCADPSRFAFSFERDPEEVQREIDGRIISATDADGIFGDEEVIKGSEYLGKPFTLESLELRPSEHEDPPFFAIFHIITTDGERRILSTGGRTVMLKAAKAATLGILPKSVKIVRSEKATAAGYHPLDLVSAPEPFPS
jgi:hypothetical protein